MGLKVDSYKAPAMDPVNAIHFLAGYLDALQKHGSLLNQDHIDDIATCIFMSAADHVLRRKQDQS